MLIPSAWFPETRKNLGLDSLQWQCPHFALFAAVRFYTRHRGNKETVGGKLLEEWGKSQAYRAKTF